jgi:prepilin-type N-terminal cleavage/methylation domain-containing protein
VKRGFVLLEVMMGVVLLGVTIVACGTALSQAVRAQRAAERRWEALVACRSALEIACAGGDVVDSTSFWPVTHVQAVIDTLGVGMVRVTSVHRGDGAEAVPAVALARLAWRGLHR